ncbi:DUF3307 domain-containing protein [Kineococcus radiotolerans]|uniref:Uncharacterized protein n=1 Tax=Kineococcus radiotolerans (strain ATCC BAA-149 / DSM 14245 / SRS30216) TaxID=266940 RepID=A6W8T4_KINRD|nr:DUF3307 domain-containing protein [Kineococcus radiotolerans]ABS03223.1 hypothetical protein Krad_1737 [Kineococcus radiotolerans SRS30216 = ATCC BAA-149]
MRTDAAPILAHLVGDYVLQTDHQAQTKTSSSATAALHAATYTLPFLALTRSPWRLAIIGGTHFAIDRWRLAKHVAWAKNQLAPASFRPGHTATGYSDDKPPWMSVWLLILTDNTLHLLINAAALEDQ